MKHSVSELTYRFLEGTADLEPLRVLAVRETHWRAWHITFTVLGASHAVTLRNDDFSGTELLTCLPPRQAFCAHIQSPAEPPQEFSLCLPRLTCRVILASFSLADGDALSGRFAAENQLSVAFPTVVGVPRLNENTTPVTRMGWQFYGSLLTVETVHTYPEEGRGVRSKSVFELEDAEP